jgi:uncharacterized membrane-anchored protein YhcB (DUF1043 family)
VYEQNELIGAVALAVLAGLVIGAFLSRRFSVEGRKQRELERDVERLAQQQKDYQQEVAAHFTDTAKLLNNLAESYRDVHNHLASGASLLCQDSPAPIIRAIADPTMKQPRDPANVITSISQPLDYAPRTSPGASGVLNEEFGLEKTPMGHGEEPGDFVHNQPKAEPEDGDEASRKTPETAS